MREDRLPLRVILQNFVNHVESLENVKEESERDEKYEQEFQDLKKLTESLKSHPDFASSEGEKECNRRKNRYKDILPYDRTRVILQPFPGIPGSDYINANYIRGASGSKAYIASQGPLPQTVPDFWRMVVECDIQVIVMASNETEGGKHKCECYWINNAGEEKQFGNVTVTFVKSRQVCPDFLVRTLKIRYHTENNKLEERTICQFHYMLWPDHGVPDAVRPLLDMVRLVRDCQASETLPVLVHCSAGCGRTGTICAIDYVWGLLRTGKLSVNLNLLSLVREMRVQRVAMVQTKEQYMLLYRAVKELFRERLSLIDAHPYENISTDGNPIKEKESDYEELFIVQEKQDQSTKTRITPSNTPSSSTTPSSSLTRKPPNNLSLEVLAHKDNLRRSASATNLHTPKALSKSGLVFHPNLGNKIGSLPLNVSSKSEDQIMKGSGLLNHPPRKTYLQQSGHSISKMEKEAENLAQQNESSLDSTCEDIELKNSIPRDCFKHQHTKSSSSSLYLEGGSKFSGEFYSSSDLKPSSLMYQETTKSALSPPVPPPRSRTPSPIIAVKKLIDKKLNPAATDSNNGKKSELSRRPSIKKLRELFEKDSLSRNKGVIPKKLSRSASSVTSRPTTLSLHTDQSSSLKVKRKGSLTNEKAEAFECPHDDKLQICPPPPHTHQGDAGQKSLNEQKSPFVSNLHPRTSSKPPSSPTFSGIRKKQKEEVNLGSEQRPALPIKKSKSFRWSRPQGMGNIFKSISRSPEVSRKNTGSNAYFVTDKPEFSLSPSVAKSEENLKKLATDFPVPNEGLKLSVYSRVGSSLKPEIPPKKSIGDKLRNPLLAERSLTGLDLQLPDEGKFLPWNKSINTGVKYGNKNKEYLSSNTYQKINPEENHDYVNAQISRTISDTDPMQKCVYVPVPTKRIGKERPKATHEYVNCSLKLPPKTDDDYSLEDSPPSTVSKMFAGEGSDSHDYKSVTPQDASDYEPVDFGESSSSNVDEVFETVNYEVFNKDKKHTQLPENTSKASAFQNYYLNRELDSIAIEVYKDCQEYLLHGTNKSRVPSLLPKDEIESNQRKGTRVTDLEEVRNKVAVPPQGLRNRERRNSYRQAVSSTPYNNKINPQKAIHKYEKIWFESARENYCDNDLFLANMGAIGGYSDEAESFIDRQKLTDLLEEELSSRDSGSTSSLLSADKLDINSRVLRPRLPSPSRSSVTSGNPPLGSLTSLTNYGSSGVSPHTNSASTSIENSQYGTLATTTSKPYKTKISDKANSDSSNTSRMINSSTLPTRSYSSVANSMHPRNTPSYSSSVKFDGNQHEPTYGYGISQMQSSAAGTYSKTKPSPNDRLKTSKSGSNLPFRGLNEDNENKLSNYAKKFNDITDVSPSSHNVSQGKSLPPNVQSKHHVSTKKSLKRNDSTLSFHPTPQYEPKTQAKKNHRPHSQDISQYKDISDKKFKELDSDLEYKDLGDLGSRSRVVASNHINQPPMPPFASSRFSEEGNGSFSTRESTRPKDCEENQSSDVASSSSSTVGFYQGSSASGFLKLFKGHKANESTSKKPPPISSKPSFSKDEVRPYHSARSSSASSSLATAGSPKPLVKAFGKLKIGSRNVAQNLKSYLKGTTEDTSRRPLQKSASYEPSINVFSEVVQDSACSTPVPKNPYGLVEENYYSDDHSNRAKSKPRQQYL